MEGNYHVSRNSHKGDRSFGFEEHTLTWGTSASSSWPARNYACSFCKREFKSAQALGGHMNVHRRDRARLRSSLISSWVSSDHHSTPKPNPSIIIKANNNNPPTTHNLSPSPSYNLSDALLNCAHPSPLYCPCLTLSSSVASASGDNKKPRLTSYSQLPPLSIPDQRGESNKMNKIISTRSTLGVEELQEGCAMGDEQLEVFNNNNNEHNNIKLELGIGMFVHPKENLDLELRLGHF